MTNVGCRISFCLQASKGKTDDANYFDNIQALDEKRHGAVRHDDRRVHHGLRDVERQQRIGR